MIKIKEIKISDLKKQELERTKKNIKHMILTLLVDRHGKVIFTGKIEISYDELEKTIDKWLEKKAREQTE